MTGISLVVENCSDENVVLVRAPNHTPIDTVRCSGAPTAPISTICLPANSTTVPSPLTAKGRCRGGTMMRCVGGQLAGSSRRFRHRGAAPASHSHHLWSYL